MSTLRISDAPLLPDVDGTEKIPTGGRGDYAISVDQIKDHIFQDIGKELVGLGNVDNTSDLDKPVSTAQQAALNLKADKTYVDVNLNLKADKTNVYTRTETTLALSKKADLVNGVVPENQIPSSFNDVLEFTTPNLPIVGESGKIYVTTDTNKTLRWGGNKYIEVSGWNTDSVSKIVTLPTYYTKEAGVAPVTGVSDGAYFNVRSEDDDTVAIEYQNVGGSAVATGKSYPSAQVIVEVQQTVAAVDGKLKRENVSVWDFFTVAELGEYRTSPSTFDAARPLQAFFDYIAANNVGCAYADAEIWVKSAITFGGASGSLTKHVKGYLKITAINTSLTATPPIETLFTFQPGSNLRWEGVIHVVGSSINSLNYDRRHVRNGIVLGGQYSATHAVIDFIIAENGFKEYGIIQDNLTTGLVIGKIRGTRSGSGYVVGGYTASLYSNFTRISDTSGTGTQRTTISVVNFADYKSQVGYVVINGEAYLITSKNEADKTLEIFPSLPTGVTTGNLKYAFGGVFYTTGGDASVANIGNVNCSTSGISMQLSALYPPTIGSITTQNNFCALSLGASISAGLEGGTVGELYFEALEFGIIQNTRYAATNITITNNVSFNPDNCIHIGNYRASDNSIDRTYPLGINVVYEGVTTQLQDFRTANTVTIPVFSPNSSPIVCAVFTQPKIVNLTEGKKSLHRLFGYSNRTIKFVGATGNVTQSITFNPPAGYTLNNQSSPLVFSNIGGTPVFEVIYHSGVNITVNLIGRGQLPSNSVTYDPPSLNATGTAGDSVTTTVTLTGATVGNVVQAAFSQYNANIEISAQVSAANTVTVKFKNTSAAAVDLASGTLTVKML